MLLEKIHVHWVKGDLSHLKQISCSCCTCCNTFQLAAKSHRLAHVFCTHQLWLGFSRNVLLKVVSYCFSSLFLFLHHSLNIATSIWLQWYLFSSEGGRDFCVMFSSNMYEQGLTGLAVYHRGIGREMGRLSLLSKCFIVAMLFNINFNFAANGLLCWGTRLHYKMTTHSWEAHLCPSSHSPCLLWDSLWVLSHSQVWWVKWPLVPWFVEYLWFVSPVGSGKLQDLKWASPLAATVPAVLGSAFSPTTAGRQEESINSFSYVAWGGGGMWGLLSFAAVATQRRERGVGRLGELVPRWGLRCPPRQGSSGNRSLLQAVQRSQSIPGDCVQHGRGTFPNSKSLNANFHPRNGLKWGW